MKKITAVLTALCMTIGILGAGGFVTKAEEVPAASAPVAGVAIDEANFPSLEIRSQARYADIMGNKDNVLSPDEATRITSLNVGKDVANLSKYLQYFPSVDFVSVETGAQTSIQITAKIKSINIRSEATSVVNIIGGTGLETVSYTTTKKAKLNFKKAKGYSAIKSIRVYGAKVTEVVVPNQSKIQNVDISGTAVSKIDISKCKKLTGIQCYEGKLKTLNISANKNLKDIGVSGSKLTKLDTSKNSKLECIVANDNKIKSIDVKKNKKLFRLEVGENKLKSLDISKNTKLQTLNISNNNMKKYKFKKGNKIKELFVGGNKIKNFSLSSYKKVTTLGVSDEYSLLKKMNFNEKMRLYIDVSKKKNHDLKKYLPKMKNCTFACAWENPELYTVSTNGILKFTSQAKKSKYTSYLTVKVIKGGKEMMLYIKY